MIYNIKYNIIYNIKLYVTEGTAAFIAGKDEIERKKRKLEKKKKEKLNKKVKVEKLKIEKSSISNDNVNNKVRKTEVSKTGFYLEWCLSDELAQFVGEKQASRPVV